MSVTTALAIYFILWWLVLFAVLPWGVRSQDESGAVVPGSDPGAPAVPRLLARLAATTAISGLIFAALYAAYVYQVVTLDQLGDLLGMPK